jgi:hypothetical protein
MKKKVAEKAASLLGHFPKPAEPCSFARKKYPQYVNEQCEKQGQFI